MSKVSVVVPFLNEEENLDRFCAYIDGQAGKADYDMEVIFVDDGSSDGGADKIRDFEFKHCHTVRLIRLSKNFGSHAALRAGISRSTGDYCTYIEADLESPEDMLDVMYEHISKGYDAVHIEKTSVKKNIFSRMASGIFSSLMRKHAVPNYRQGGINNIMMSRKIVDFLNENIEKNSALQLQIIDAGFDSVIVGMDYRSREAGRSKWTLSKKIKLFIDSFVSFSYFPLRLVTIVGLIFALAGAVYGISLVVLRLLDHELQQGFPTIVVVMLLGFGVTNISLGVIAEYLWRTFDAAKNRPVFIISDEKDVKGKT